MTDINKSLSEIFTLAANEPLTDRGLDRANNPPHDDTSEDHFGVTVKDPFRPMEASGAANPEEDDWTPSAETMAWIGRKKAQFDEFARDTQDFQDKAIAFFEGAIPTTMRESIPSKIGDKYIVYRKEAHEERWSLYIKDVPDFGAPARLVLSPEQLDPTGRTNIVGINPTKDGKTLAYRLSVSGSDNETIRFMDIKTGEDLDLVYTDMRTAIRWDRDGQGFTYSVRHKDIKSNDIRYHKMGTPIEDDKVIFDAYGEEHSAGVFYLYKDSKDEPGAYQWVMISNTEPNKNAILVRPRGSQEEFREIFPLKEGTLYPVAEINGKIYATSTVDAPNGKLVSFDVNDAATEKWQSILPENEQDGLIDVSIWQNKIFAAYNHNTAQIMKVFDLSGNYLYDVPIPPLSTFSMGGFQMDDTEAYVSYDNFQEQSGDYKYDSVTNTMTLVRESDMPINLKDCIVEQIFATSNDGTQVPMTVIRHPDTKLDGTAATMLYGYGGFEVALEPGFSAKVAHWVREGGIYVQANLRGGGEFGQKWYDDGRQKNKQNVFDDFASCAIKLIIDKYTSGERLAVQGGSNGGLLALAALIQHDKMREHPEVLKHPEILEENENLIGLFLPQVPVADVLRFYVGSYYGFGWKSDYGDPTIKEDFNVAAKYSPLQNVPQDFEHPPVVIETDIDDNRVLPWHALKMAAMLQAKEDPSSLTLLRVKDNGGGHGAGMTERQYYADAAVDHALANKVLHGINQDEYKAWKAAQKKPEVEATVMPVVPVTPVAPPPAL